MLLVGLLLSLQNSDPVTWKKVVVDSKFRSEAAATGDVNRDGQLDILVGDFWYDGKNLKPFEIRKPLDLGDGFSTYSEAFAVFADDVNRDGWIDQIVIGYPGKAARWYENPKKGSGHWTERVLWPSACNESPHYSDLFRDGKRVLVMGVQPTGQENQGQMVWLEPGKEPDAPWQLHPISEESQPGREIPGTHRFAHGLGVGDVNGDGRNDVLTMEGWWEQPREGRRATHPWTFHAASFGGAAAHLIVQDISGDGKADVIASSAHNYGVWSAIQSAGGFEQRPLFPDLVSSAHSMVSADINGDRVSDLVTGKRFWAHGWSDPGARDPSRLYYLRGKRAPDKSITFDPIVVDEDSGVGTGFVVVDFNRDKQLDIVISNKKGVFVFLQNSRSKGVRVNRPIP